MAFTQAQKQDFFNQAYLGVMQQGALGSYRLKTKGLLNPVTHCVYETPCGHHCGIGHILKSAGLLPPTDSEDLNLLNAGVTVSNVDGYFNEDKGPQHFEGMLVLATLLVALGADESDLSFLDDLQRAHDVAHGMADFHVEMRSLAKKEGLDVPSLIA